MEAQLSSAGGLPQLGRNDAMDESEGPIVVARLVPAPGNASMNGRAYGNICCSTTPADFGEAPAEGADVAHRLGLTDRDITVVLGTLSDVCAEHGVVLPSNLGCCLCPMSGISAALVVMLGLAIISITVAVIVLVFKSHIT